MNDQRTRCCCLSFLVKQLSLFPMELLIAFLFASALDVDHFIAAGTLRLSAATSLTARPYNHAITVVIVEVW